MGKDDQEKKQVKRNAELESRIDQNERKIKSWINKLLANKKNLETFKGALLEAITDKYPSFQDIRRQDLCDRQGQIIKLLMRTGKGLDEVLLQGFRDHLSEQFSQLGVYG